MFEPNIQRILILSRRMTSIDNIGMGRKVVKISGKRLLCQIECEQGEAEVDVGE